MIYDSILHEFRINYNTQKLIETINDLQKEEMIKNIRIGEINSYSIRTLNIQFILILPILFFIFAVIFFLILDEYFRKRIK